MKVMDAEDLRARARHARSEARRYQEEALALERQARVVELSEGLDHLGVPRTVGRSRVVKELRDRGWTLDNELAAEIVKHRKEYR